MADLRISYIRITDVDEDGDPIAEPLYTFFMYDDYATAYGSERDTLEEVKEDINRENVVEILQRDYPEFFTRAQKEDEYFIFLGDKMSLQERKNAKEAY